MILLDRAALGKALRELEGSVSEQAFLTWIAAAMVGDQTEISEGDELLVARVIGIIDAASESPARLQAVAMDVLNLLGTGLPNDAVRELIPIARTRARLLDVLSKLASGTLTRRAFLSFVAEQGWSRGVRERVAALSEADLQSVVRALLAEDYASLATVLL